MRPLLAGKYAMVLENGDVLEPRVAFQIRNAVGIGREDAFNLFILELCKLPRVVPGLDDNFMSPDRLHPVEDSLRLPPRIAFDVVQRIEVSHDAHLPVCLRGYGQDGSAFDAGIRTQRAAFAGGGRLLAMADDHPTASDGIFAEFHSVGVSACSAPVWALPRGGDG